jgi:hypothetical protein
MIEPVTPAKAEKPPTSFLEEGEHLRQGSERFYAITGIETPS